MPNNGSFIGVNLNDKANDDLAKIIDVEFIWEFPYIEEDI